jgi:signal transduction histidine kinase
VDLVSDGVQPAERDSAAEGGEVDPARGWRRLSIGIKLPLGVAVLLVLASATLSGAAYWHVRQLAFELASERLNLAATQLEAVIGPALRQRVSALTRVSVHPDVLSYLDEPTAGHRDTVVALLTAVPAGNGRSGIALFDADGHLLLASGGVSADELSANPLIDAGVGAIGSIRRGTKDAELFYDMVVPVRHGSQLRARLLERRWLSSSPAPGLNLLSSLIGPDARLLIGNRDGSLWTDFRKAGAPLPADVTHNLVPYTTADGQPFVARGVDVRDSPWILAASTPIAPVLSPADRFLLRALWVTSAIVVLGAVAGWLFSRRVTQPLRQLANTAETIASPESRLTADRSDEVARLGNSFAKMVARVDESHRQLQQLVDELEVRVQARTAALEEANRELEAFSYSVSHDLRAPIRAISAFANILVEDHGSALSADARHCIDIVIKRAKHMGQLIDDLLMFSRLGRQPMTRQAVSMKDICAAAVSELNSVDPTRKVDVVIGDMPDANAEPALLRQVIANLLQNAIKYTRRQPTARIEFGCQSQDGETVYYVRDNGVGFDMQYADRLFGVFQRLHRDEDFEGTGVGLAIVQRIVNRHGGRVWADAVVNGGATFFFTLAPGEISAKEAA